MTEPDTTKYPLSEDLPAGQASITGLGGMRSAAVPSADGYIVVVRPWRALWGMMVGYFMIIVDSTVVAVANPTIMVQLHVGYDSVVWVTSIYLLTYAVPLLLAGRLGDRFGIKNLYQVGLILFTAASLWCGLSDSIGALISARLFQGIGAAFIAPQALSIIGQIFPPERRGAATSVLGATAGVATLIGPLVGGVLVDQLGWQWIFIVNVPVGVAGIVLAAKVVPAMPTRQRRLDLPGVALSGVGIFLIVFGLQQGQLLKWSLLVWAIIASGLAAITGFVYWQAITTGEPLIPLGIFKDRNFSLSTLGYAIVGFVVTAFLLPVMFYAQLVCGLPPTRSALLAAPISIMIAVCAPIAGNLVNRLHPRAVVGCGFTVLVLGLTWLSFEMTPTSAIWRLVMPLIMVGVGMGFIWIPLTAIVGGTVLPHQAGAASGVYNAIRQLGAVLGSASMAAFLTSRVAAELPPLPAGVVATYKSVAQLPTFLQAGFSTAMAQSMLLPIVVALPGLVAALFLTGNRNQTRGLGGRRCVTRRRLRAPNWGAKPGRCQP